MAGVPSEADQKLLATCRMRLQMSMDALSDSRDSELDDLRFLAGSPDNQFQWPRDVLGTRGAVTTGQTIAARPCLTINKLPEHCHQVTNEQRQNQPSGKVIPASEDADVEIAEIFEGMVRYIEYISNARVAYSTACDNQVGYGEGYARILTEFCSDDSMDQDIKIGRVRNSFSVYMDPTIQDPCGMDAEWCHITEDLLKEEYEREYPDAMPCSSIQAQGVGDELLSAWLNDKTVRIAEYFYKEYTPKKLNLYVGNMTAFEGTPKDAQIREMGLLPIRDRMVQVCSVKWFKTNGYEILKEEDWAGKYIPVLRLIGNEFEIDGQLYISGLVRNAKDAQRMYNYWVSQEAEMLALAPKAPFIGYAGQFEGFESHWKNANTIPYPYLEVNPGITDNEGRVLPLPQRSQPPMASSGLLQAKLGAADDIKSATGQYNASLGQTSNERTGKAILAREHQAAVGTYHFVDNYAYFVQCITVQIIDLVPKIYDTERVTQIMGEDDSLKTVKLNPAQKTAVNEVRDEQGAILKIYNPNVGKYHVRATTGPSYVTKRQETQAAMGEVLSANPDLWKIAGDLFVKNMDWPGAQEMAKRLKLAIDPKLLAGDDQSPELQAAQAQIQGMAHEMEAMHQMLISVQHSFEARDADRADYEAQVKAFDAITKRLTAIESQMNPDQIQQIVLGTVHSMIDAGDLLADPPQDDSGGLAAPPGGGMMPAPAPSPQMTP